MKLRLESVAGKLPRPVFDRLFRQALGRRDLALCLHRVLPKHRDTDPLKSATALRAELDELVERLASLRQGEGRVSLVFDDGYADAVDYVRETAPRYPDIEWLLCLCPAKTTQRLGFRWDAFEYHKPGGTLREWVNAPQSVEKEHQREELAGLGDNASFRLASLEEVEAARAVANVALANHTNHHFKLAHLDDNSVRRELEESHRDFADTFGPSQHFAFPFGTPGSQFGEREVSILRAIDPSMLIWTTEQKIFRSEERRPGAVLPRIVHDGTLNVDAMLGRIADRALKSRLHR